MRVKRWIVVLGIALVAGFAIWHPAGHGGSAITQVPAVGSHPTRRARTAAPQKLAGALVYVVGAVVRPGLYTVSARARV